MLLDGRALSSAVEHQYHTLGVAGSKPAARTIFPQEIEVSGVTDTVLTQETAEFENAKVKYPKRIKHRGRVLATICGSCKGRDSYRVAWPVAGQRHMASFAACSPAMIHAHYKGLATNAGAQKWFVVLPPDAAKNVIPLRKVRP